MIKYVLLVAFAFSASANAQVGKSVSADPIVTGKGDSPKANTEYCVYEDKKYTEGSVKRADGIAMICMRENSFTTIGPSSVAPLIWEPATSARGREKLNLKSSADIFK